MQSEKDLAKLFGPAMLVCTRSPEVTPGKFHLVVGDGGALQLAPGSR